MKDETQICVVCGTTAPVTKIDGIDHCRTCADRWRDAFACCSKCGIVLPCDCPQTIQEAINFYAKKIEKEQNNMSATKTKKTVNLNLIGIDGNAFSVMGAFSRQARSEGWSQEEIDAVLTEAKSGDYDHLLGTIMDHCKSGGF